MRLALKTPVAVAVALMVVGSPLAASALVAGGGVVPNTSTASATAQLAGPPTVVKKLHTPGSPSDDSPAAVDALGSPAAPDDDLIDALDALATAPDTAAATAARSRALDILEGNPVDGRAYSGIPLLNWNGPERVKTVPAGGTVTVNTIRFRERTLSDTSLLQFDDANAPFTITYHVTELGDVGGVFSPTPLLTDGTTPVGGLASVVVPLALPNLLTDTTDTNKFHPGGGSEMTRAAVQEITVKMPPPHLVAAVLDPDARLGHPALATLAPATPARLAALQSEYGFSSLTPTDAEKAAAIARLGAASPAKLLWTALTQLDPADPAFLATAHAAGTQNRPLVDGIVTRTTIPAGIPTTVNAGLSVALVGGEAYVSHSTISPHGVVNISVTNGDAFARTFSVYALHDRKAVHGALDYGQFAWSTAATATLAPGESRVVRVDAGGATFALWVGDADGGDQAGMVVNVDNGPAVRSLDFGDPSIAPSHVTQDAAGNLWLTLAGVDSIARVTPSADVASSSVSTFLLPGGNFGGTSTVFPLAPHDLTIDAHGIVWITLATGNGIARLDPALAKDGTSDGITITPMAACNLPLPACAPPIPPVPNHPPISRIPNQIRAVNAPNGDTVLWFTESGADAIGGMRFAPDGTLVAHGDLNCMCNEPLGIALGGDGAVWFTSIVGNEVVRMRPSLNTPFDGKTATFDRFPIPSSVTVIDPVHPAPGIETAGAHSLAIDPQGRVWVTEEETSKVGFLDPATAAPGSTAGFTEFPLGKSDFGAPVQPADFTIDAAGTVFWADEYGDVVGSVTPLGVVSKWRPAERASLTDGAFVDAQGNFWFTEAGAGLLTRITGVAEPTRLAGGPSPVVTADLTHATLSGTSFTNTTSVTVDVTLTNGAVSHFANVPTAAGLFSVTVPGLTGDAVVRITRHAPISLPTLSFSVAALEVTANASGVVSGRIQVGGQPAGMTEPLVVAIADTTSSIVPSTTGAFSTTVAPGTAGTITASGATVSGIFRTVASFAVPAPAAPSVLPANPTPAGDQPHVDLGPLAPTLATGPTTPSAISPALRACDMREWLTGGNVALLGMSASDLTACLGKPNALRRARPSQLWVYGRNQFRVHNGVVIGLDLRDGTFFTDPGHVGVGWPTWELSSQLPKLRFDRKTRTFRAVTHLSDGRVADIRISESRRGRIARIVVHRQTIAKLDRFARGLV